MNKATKLYSDDLPRQVSSLEMVHLAPHPDIVNSRFSSGISGPQLNFIVQQLRAGESITAISKSQDLSWTVVKSIAVRNKIDQNDIREYSDIDIIFGKKLSLKGGSCITGLPIYDEETKKNFTTLLEKNFGLIIWCINKIGYRPPEGEDELIQVIRIMLYYKYHGYSPFKMPFSKWIILRTCAIIKTHRSRSLKCMLKMDEGVDLSQMKICDDSRHEEEDDNILALRKAISELPERQRKIMKLALEGFEPEAIAIRVGTSIDAIKTTLYHVRLSIFEYRDRWFSGIKVYAERASLLEIGKTNVYDSIAAKNGFTIPTDKLAEIKRLIKFLPQKEVAEAVGVNVVTVRKVARKFNLQRVTAKRKRIADNKELVGKITELLKTKSIQWITKELQLSRGLISRMIKQGEINMAGAKCFNKIPPEKENRIIELLKKGELPKSRIAYLVKVSIPTVDRIERVNGLKKQPA